MISKNCCNRYKNPRLFMFIQLTCRLVPIYLLYYDLLLVVVVLLNLRHLLTILRCWTLPCNGRKGLKFCIWVLIVFIEIFEFLLPRTSELFLPGISVSLTLISCAYFFTFVCICLYCADDIEIGNRIACL